MSAENPIILARRVAEQHIPLEAPASDWDERWDVAQAYIEELLAGQVAPLTISREQRVSIAEMDYQSHVNEIPQRLQFQQDLALAALKGLTLVNGGAIVGLLTFIGNRSVPADQLFLGYGISLFIAGLILNLIAYIMGYFSQATFMEVTIHQAWNEQRIMVGVEIDGEPERITKIGNRWLYAAIGSAFLSLAAFGIGSTFVARAFFG